MPDTEKDGRGAGTETITVADASSQNVTAVASLAKVLQYFGVELDAESFVKEHAKETASWESLTKLARKYHIRARLSRPTMEELREVELPAMARMADGTYVVLAVAGDDVVYLLDPRQAQPVVLSSAQFAEVWGKELLLFSGALSLDYFKKLSMLRLQSVTPVEGALEFRYTSLDYIGEDAERYKTWLKPEPIRYIWTGRKFRNR